MVVEQLLREWPPGYGGVERVAHELANSWGGTVFSFDVQRQRFVGQDPIPLGYTRRLLPSTRVLVDCICRCLLVLCGNFCALVLIYMAISLLLESCLF